MSFTIEIALTQGKSVLINSDDVEFAAYNWQFDKVTGYAKRKFTIDGKRVTKYLHRMIFEKHNSIELLKDEFVDHENNNRLDCTTANLRLATPAQNACNKEFRGNKSGFKGVTQKGTWFYAIVSFQNVRHFAGKFETAELAAQAYIIKATEIQREFAKV